MQNMTIEEIQPISEEVLKQHIEQMEKEQTAEQQEQPTDKSPEQQ